MPEQAASLAVKPGVAPGTAGKAKAAPGPAMAPMQKGGAMAPAPAK
jgi:hypothetical protein